MSCLKSGDSCFLEYNVVGLRNSSTWLKPEAFLLTFLVTLKGTFPAYTLPPTSLWPAGRSLDLFGGTLYMLAICFFFCLFLFPVRMGDTNFQCPSKADGKWLGPVHIFGICRLVVLTSVLQRDSSIMPSSGFTSNSTLGVVSNKYSITASKL